MQLLVALFAQTFTPTPLATVDAVEKLCADVAPLTVEEREEEIEKDRSVFERVYRIVVDPQVVRFEPYDAEAKHLPLALDRSLLALDGAVVLGVMDRRGAAFSIDEATARGIVAKAEQKQVRIAIDFVVDGEMSEVAPCFSYPKSETWSIRIAPLSYELADAGGHVLARVRTDRMEEMADKLSPKKAEVKIVARVHGGVVDEAQLTRSVLEKRAAIEACVEGVKSSRDKTGVVGLTASIQGGKIVGARAEIEAIDDPQAATCLASALATVKPPSTSGAQIGVVVSIDRTAVN